MRANLSILGLYQYDSTILNGLINALPKDPDTGADLVKADVLVNNILLECAELEVCYPENPDFAVRREDIGLGRKRMGADPDRFLAQDRAGSRLGI